MDTAQANLFRQLDGMQAHLEKSDAPGEWTAREVLSHLLFEPGFDPVATLRTFHPTNLQLIDLAPGSTHLDGQRKAMGLGQFKTALEQQRTNVAAYVGALFDYHWNDHAGQLAKIRKAAGLSEAK